MLYQEPLSPHLLPQTGSAHHSHTAPAFDQTHRVSSALDLAGALTPSLLPLSRDPDITQGGRVGISCWDTDGA